MAVPFADFRRDDFLEWCRRIDDGPFSTLGAETAGALAAMCRLDTDDVLRETLRMVDDAGADEFVLVPVSGDLDQLERAIDVVAAHG